MTDLEKCLNIIKKFTGNIISKENKINIYINKDEYIDIVFNKDGSFDKIEISGGYNEGKYRSDFWRCCHILRNSQCEDEIDIPFTGNIDMKPLEGFLTVWDKNGMNSILLIFNPDKSFKNIFIND